jgi:hypothetical protein
MHLNELSSELYSMRSATLDLKIYLEKMRNKEYLELKDSLEELWNTLIKWASVGASIIHPDEGELLSFDQKTTLSEWITDLIDIPHKEMGRPRKLLGWSQDSLMPPVNLQDVQIWRHRYSFTDKGRRFLGYFYWGSIFSQLDRWRKQISAELEIVEWAADSAAVSLVMKWKGTFQSIEMLDIEEAPAMFWTVTFRSEEPAHLSTTSATHLLNVQLLARSGGNKLVPIELHDGLLTMALEISRADTGALYPPSHLREAEGVQEQLGRYLIDQALPGYMKVSEQLERVLSKEIDRLGPYMLEDAKDEFYFNRLQGVVDRLRAAREALMNDWRLLS